MPPRLASLVAFIAALALRCAADIDDARAAVSAVEDSEDETVCASQPPPCRL